MIVDLHEDIASYFMMNSPINSIEDFKVDSGNRQVDIPKYKKASVKIVFGSVFPMLGNLNIREIEEKSSVYGSYSSSSIPVSPRDVAIEQIKIYKNLEKIYPDDIKIITKKSDIDGLSGRTGIIIHLEGCEALYEPEDIEIFYELGLRSIGLTWNFDNKYASSCFSKKDYGLTGSGNELINVANKLSIMIDLAHASEKTCKEVISLSKKPPFVSHANLRSVTYSPRNISDEVAKLLSEAKGIVGLTLIRSCIGAQADSQKLAEHAKKAMEFSAELPAIGTDFLGIQSTPDDIRDITWLYKLKESLSSIGVHAEFQDKIFYQNALNYIELYSNEWG